MPLTFDDDQAAALLTALGLPADTADVDLAFDTIKDAAAASTAEGAAPSAVAAAARRHGMEAVDSDTYAQLQRDATEGRKIKAAAEQQRIEASVDDAINKGKITPARKKHWVSLISADPEMAKVLASTPNETAAPLSEIGHSAGDDLAETAEWFH